RDGRRDRRLPEPDGQPLLEGGPTRGQRRGRERGDAHEDAAQPGDRREGAGLLHGAAAVAQVGGGAIVQGDGRRDSSGEVRSGVAVHGVRKLRRTPSPVKYFALTSKSGART